MNVKKQNMGRPPKPIEDRAVPLRTSLTRELRGKYSRLGGSKWLVRALTEAKEPADA